jgi:hypothetical protein
MSGALGSENADGTRREVVDLTNEDDFVIDLPGDGDDEGMDIPDISDDDDIDTNLDVNSSSSDDGESDDEIFSHASREGGISLAGVQDIDSSSSSSSSSSDGDDELSDDELSDDDEDEGGAGGVVGGMKRWLPGRTDGGSPGKRPRLGM